MDQNPNPYEVSRSLLAPVILTQTHASARQAGQRNFRTALVILLIAAAGNVACYNHQVFSGWPNPFQSLLFQGTNWSWLVATSVLIWFWGLALLEWIAGCVHALRSPQTTLEMWKLAVYDSLGLAPLLAILGAITWVVWIAGFYFWNLDFYLISIPVGIVAHLLAAGLYLPLLYRWYQLSSRAV